MKARVNTFLNIRTGTPEILPHNNPNDAFFKPGDVVEIVETVVGEEYKGNDVWHKLDSGVFVSNFGLDIDENLFFKASTPFSTDNDLSKKIKLKNQINGNGRGIIIGVFDSGVDVRHPALKAAVENEEDFLTNKHNSAIENKHGTMVAGILVANDHKISGLSINAKIKSFRVIRNEKDESTDEIGLKAALEKVANQNINVDILNLSLDIDIDSVPIFQTIINKIFDKGIIITVAANKGSINSINSIATLNNVISAGVFNETEFVSLKTGKIPKEIFLAYLNSPIETTGLFTSDTHSPFDSSSAYTAITTGIIANFLSNKHIPKEKRYFEVKKYLSNCSFDIKQESQSSILKPYNNE